MSAAIGIAAVLAIVLGVVTLYRRANIVDPGAVSHRWISEHRAQQLEGRRRSL